jgi:hypothetical protein
MFSAYPISAGTLSDIGSEPIVVTVTGLSVTGFVGQVTVSAEGDVIVLVTGTQAAVLVGSVFAWGVNVPTQDPFWVDIPTSQDPNWEEIEPSPSGNWKDGTIIN